MSEGDETRSLGPARGRRAPGGTLYGDELSPGALAGDYLVESVISSGGWGTVYLARHRMLGRQAAVKVLHRDLARLPKQFKRFLREAKTVNRIGHPNIVDVFEFGRLPDGRPYFVMELLEGRALDQHLDDEGRMSATECLEILGPLCAALGAAHEAGVVHRDLKASNVHVVRREGRWQVKLLDFGIAKYMEPDEGGSGITSTGTRLGTPDSMAPEQIRGLPADARTDIYALGILLYRMLTGRTPFRADDAVEVERQHLEAEPPPPSQVAPLSEAVDRVVLRCLAKEPAGRFDSTASFLEALRRALRERRGGEQRRAATLRAIAIHVEAQIDAEADDGSLLDDLAEVLDTSEDLLEDAGYLLALHTGSAALAIRAIDGEGTSERRLGLDVARDLYGQLSARPNADPRVRIVVCVHVGQVMMEQGPHPRVVGGELMRLSGWPLRDLDAGVFATRAMADGVDDCPLDVID